MKYNISHDLHSHIILYPHQQTWLPLSIHSMAKINPFFSYPKPYPEFLTQRNIVYIILPFIYRVSYCVMYPFISSYTLITYSDNQTDPYRICVVKTAKTARQLRGFDDPWGHGYNPNNP